MNSITGLAAHVPFVALPPESGVEKVPMVIVWHLLDVPRTEVAMSSALPLHDVDAWRVYLGLPMTGSRAMQEQAEDMDPVLDFFQPILEQTVSEFPAALDDLRRQVPADETPIKLVGASLSCLVVQTLLADTEIPVSAAALVSPATTLSGLVAANERAFGMSYPWDDKSRTMAQRYDFVARADELAKRNVPMVLVIGADDVQELRAPAEKLWQALSNQGEPANYSLVSVPDMGHALAEEPGVAAAPQTAQAVKVDGIVSDWLSRY